jgi:hypothetical protein
MSYIVVPNCNQFIHGIGAIASENAGAVSDCLGEHGSSELSEALAEYLAYYIAGDAFGKNTATIQQLARPILLPKPEDLSFNEHCTKAMQALYVKDYLKASSEFKTATSTIPSAPLPHELLGECYAHLKDEVSAFNECRIACEEFESAGVPYSEKRRRMACEMFALILARDDQDDHYEQALKLTASVPSEDPGSTQALNTKSFCERKLGRLGASIQDYYLANQNLEEKRPAPRESDLQKKRKKFDDSVEKSPTSGWALRSRAVFLQELAKRSRSQEKKRKIYKSALADFQESLKLQRLNYSG